MTDFPNGVDGPAYVAPEDVPLLSLTMTPEAAARFVKAVGYAEAVLHGHAEAVGAPVTKAKIEEHGEWLRWAQARVYNLLADSNESLANKEHSGD